MKWTITEASPEVTLSQTTANVESEFLRITVPDVYVYAVEQSTLMDLVLQTSVGNDLNDDAEIKVYVARPDRHDKKFLARFTYKEVKYADPYDRTKAFYLELPQALALPERFHLVFTVNDSVVADTSKTQFLFYVEKIQK